MNKTQLANYFDHTFLKPYATEADLNQAIKLAKEELSHFEMVHQKIKDRGFKLGFERKDDYVGKLYKFMRKEYRKEIVLIDRLLFGAMIEARSCERFKLLSEKINDEDLKVIGFNDVAQNSHHYEEYEARLLQTAKDNINYLGICIYGPKKKINRLTGSMKMLR